MSKAGGGGSTHQCLNAKRSPHIKLGHASHWLPMVYIKLGHMSHWAMNHIGLRITLGHTLYWLPMVTNGYLVIRSGHVSH